MVLILAIWDKHKAKELFKFFQTIYSTLRLLRHSGTDWIVSVPIWKHSKSILQSWIRKTVIRPIWVGSYQNLQTSWRDNGREGRVLVRWTPQSLGVITKLSSLNMRFWYHLGRFRIFQQMTLVCRKTASGPTLTISKQTILHWRLQTWYRHVLEPCSRPLDLPVAFPFNWNWWIMPLGCKISSL